MPFQELLSANAKRPAIDFKIVAGVLGAFLTFLGLALLIPAIVAWIYKEDAGYAFLISSGGAALVGGLNWYFFKPQYEVRMREGFLIVGLTWLLLSLVGAFPFVLSGTLDSYTDAVFETMSGLSTTGATILGGQTPEGLVNPAIEDIPKSLLFWRSLAHWLGGMGIIVLSIAILPLLGVGGMQLFQAEASGIKADKLTPRVQETAKLLWVLYVLWTLIEFVLLWLHPAMDWFDAINHAMATLATGGFSTKNASVAAYNSWYIDLVITIFMFLAGINFALQLRLRSKNRSLFFENRELRLYTLITMVSTLIVSIVLWYSGQYNLLNALRHGAFQVVSIITTTGFGTSDYAAWAAPASFFILLLFFTGGMAGSTAGGVKMIRILVLIKSGLREFKQILHPRAILPLRMGNQVIEPSIQQTVLSFFLLYIFVFGLGGLVISLFGYDLVSAFSASIACLGNVGPGFGLFGPTESFVHMPVLGKWICIFLMMVGRLEIFTILILFSPEFWRK
jgi:trk system potassium uptake protein TrkH